jgi:hypothetical protein
MPQITRTKIQNVFSFSTGAWLNWSDESPDSEKPDEHFDSESEESQSIDSDHSSDFWYNWNPEIDKMIIARRATSYDHGCAFSCSKSYSKAFSLSFFVALALF